MIGALQISAPLVRFLERIGLSTGLAESIAAATVFVIVTLALYGLGKAVVLPIIDRLMRQRNLEESARKPLRKLMIVLLVFVAIAVAFAVAGYGDLVQSLATVAAAATLAIGFALQDVVKNFVAGIFIFTDKPFRIGDWIEWKDNSGIVEDISFRVTRVRTFDNELLTVPNSDLTGGVIKNPVAKGTLRLKFVFGIDYEDDVEAATEIIVEEAENHPDILEDPAPTVRLTELADSYVGLQSRIWIDNPSRADFIRTRSEYAKAVKRRFDDEGISIPFPQRDLSGTIEATAPPEVVED